MGILKFREFCKLLKEGLIKTHSLIGTKDIKSTIDILTRYLTAYQENNFNFYFKIERYTIKNKFSLYVENYNIKTYIR